MHRLINKEEAERKKQNRVSRTRTWSIGRLLEANELMVWVGVKKRVPEQLTTRGLACVEWSSDSQTRESESGVGTAEWSLQGRVCEYNDESGRVQSVKIGYVSLTPEVPGSTVSF